MNHLTPSMPKVPASEQDMNLARKSLLQKCFGLAVGSPDPSTQNAAIILPKFHTSVSGINQFPKGVQYLPERWERPIKYRYIEHAERNAIYQAARCGVPLQDALMVCPWAACTDCARGIIQSGIKELITYKKSHDNSSKSWIPDIDIAFTMLREAGIIVTMYDGPLCAQPIRMNGEQWNPSQ